VFKKLAMKILNSIAATLVMLFAFTCYADDAWLPLEKAAQAAHDLSYEGIYSYHLGQTSKAVQITHVNYGQGEYARVLVLDGKPREALTQGLDTIFFNANPEKIIIEKRRNQQSFPAVLPNNLESIKQNYLIQSAGSERIAGRDAQIFQLQPKDQYRFGYKFWVDKEYGLLLKSANLDQSGNAVESISFTQLVFTSGQNLDWFRPSQLASGKNFEMQKASVSNLAENEINCDVPIQLLGYQRIHQMKQQIQQGQRQRTHLLYSDGLSSLSIFVEPMIARNHPYLGYNQVGNTAFMGVVMDGHQIMVVGNVPQTTVHQFVNVVKIKKK
jgi:sigma-E factor negative regulatory protein RseB